MTESHIAEKVGSRETETAILEAARNLLAAIRGSTIAADTAAGDGVEEVNRRGRQGRRGRIYQSYDSVLEMWGVEVDEKSDRLVAQLQIGEELCLMNRQ